MVVHEPRPEDVALIDRWLRSRAGIEPEPITIAELYNVDNAPPAQFLSPATIYVTKKYMMAFARRCRVPLREVGLMANGAFTAASVREEILAYAEDYAARNASRISALVKLVAKDEQKRPEVLSWRTAGWLSFVDIAKEFYNWLERQGLRPRGSNPLLDIRRFPPIHIKREILIVEDWYNRIFKYPKSIKYEALILLLANGFRRVEVASALAADFTYSMNNDSTLRVVGKRNKVRTVFLYNPTADAVMRWINARRHQSSRWLFPGRWPVRHITTNAIEWIVNDLCEKVFPGPEEEHIRRRITPHKFRHYFASNALYRGMKPPTVQAQLGHSSLIMTNHYVHMDPEWIRQELQAINQGGMINVPRSAGDTPSSLFPRPSTRTEHGLQPR